jgi:hypothetical protein
LPFFTIYICLSLYQPEKLRVNEKSASSTDIGAAAPGPENRLSEPEEPLPTGVDLHLGTFPVTRHTGSGDTFADICARNACIIPAPVMHR